MIKIELSGKTKRIIINKHWKDINPTKNKIRISFIDILKSNITTIAKHPKLFNYLFDNSGNVKTQNIKKLICGSKEDLENIIMRLDKFNEKDSKELVNNVFQYQKFSQRIWAKNLLKELNVRVCPYCNRQYTFTLNNQSVRPQFDHYYPKTKYPYLAISLFNLIPSCNICNQAKSTLDTYDKPILYPYEQEFGQQIYFITESENLKYLQGIGDDFSINIDNYLHKLPDEVQVQIKQLHLLTLYNEHKDYVVDLIQNFRINTPERIDEIMSLFPGMYNSKEELMGKIFMNDIRKERWGNRPLAKLTHDIYKDINNKK